MKTFIDYLRFRFTASPFKPLKLSVLRLVLLPLISSISAAQKKKERTAGRSVVRSSWQTIKSSAGLTTGANHSGAGRGGICPALAVPGLIAGISWPSLCHPSVVSCGGSMSL